MQLRVRHIARNVLSNWFGSIASMVVSLYLAPFILHRLGEVAYGVWILAVSVVSYLSLLDLGMQNAVLRFVSKGHTRGDHEGASTAMSAALWVRLQISGLVLLLSVGLSIVFPLLFKVPPQLADDARKALLLIGAATAVTMSMGVVGGVLSALNRYDLWNTVLLFQTAIRAGGAVYVLRTGHGIVAIGVCELIAAIAGNLLMVWIAHRLYPQLKVRLTKPQRGTLRQIWTYSSFAFLNTVAVQLVYQTDNLVVGAFVSAAAVFTYGIANSQLLRNANFLINSMGNTFVPAASTYEASGDTTSLRNLYTYGTRMTMVISLPILLTFITRGSTFIGLWLGPKFAHDSGLILVILSIPMIFSHANRTASAVAFGIEKHKATASATMVEGVANLALSIFLVRWHHLGIYGVAIGTLVPGVLIQLVFWPRYISRLVGLSAFEVIWKVWGPMFLAAAPFTALSYWVDHTFHPHHLVTFFLQVAATLPVFLLCVALCFRDYLRATVVPRVRSLWFAQAR